MSQTELLKNLPANNLQISNDVAQDGRGRLSIHGSPAAYRWLASLLIELADRADNHTNGASVIVSTDDLRQVTMSDWAAMELACLNKIAQQNPSGS